MIRSRRKRPLGLSISYFTLEPCGISMMAFTVRGAASPGGTPCQGWETVIIFIVLKESMPCCSAWLVNVFQINKPFAVQPDNADGRCIFFITVGKYIQHR